MGKRRRALSKLIPPLAPMEAKVVEEVPADSGWIYEPKWDGFRCLAFRDNRDVYLQSKSGKPLTRYFPDVVQQILKLKAPRFVADGEIVVPVNGKLEFDVLLQRIHPAASRVQKLAEETPATFILFDLLSLASSNYLDQPLEYRKNKLAEFAATYLRQNDAILVSPSTLSLKQANKWFAKSGGDLDGVVAKRIDMPYRSGLRDGMVKIKLRKTADCVIGGFRYAEGTKLVGSILLGVFDKNGKLDHIGFSSSFDDATRRELTKKLTPLIGPPGFTGSAPGGPSRWSTARSEKWQPLKTKLVVEVEYDQLTGGRFRHGTRFLRWRPDKDPGQCTYEQFEHESVTLNKIMRLKSSKSSRSAKTRASNRPKK